MKVKPLQIRSLSPDINAGLFKLKAIFDLNLFTEKKSSNYSKKNVKIQRVFFLLKTFLSYLVNLFVDVVFISVHQKYEFQRVKFKISIEKRREVSFKTKSQKFWDKLKRGSETGSVTSSKCVLKPRPHRPHQLLDWTKINVMCHILWLWKKDLHI